MHMYMYIHVCIVHTIKGHMSFCIIIHVQCTSDDTHDERVRDGRLDVKRLCIQCL